MLTITDILLRLYEGIVLNAILFYILKFYVEYYGSEKLRSWYIKTFTSFPQTSIEPGVFKTLGQNGKPLMHTWLDKLNHNYHADIAAFSNAFKGFSKNETYVKVIMADVRYILHYLGGFITFGIYPFKQSMEILKVYFDNVSFSKTKRFFYSLVTVTSDLALGLVGMHMSIINIIANSSTIIGRGLTGKIK